MSDSDLQITITADASGVAPGIEQAKSALTGLGATLSGVQSTVSGFSAAVAKAFVAPNVSGLTGVIGQVRAATADLAASMAQAGVSIREEASQAAAAEKAGEAQRVASSTAASNAIADNDKQVTAGVVQAATQQTAAASSADTVRTASSDRATAHLMANNRKVLNSLRSSIDGMVAGFNKGMLQMAEGSKSFAQVMRSLGQQLLDDMLRVVDQIVDKWIWGETEKVLATTQGQGLLNALGLKDEAQQVLIDTRKVAANAAANTAIVSSNNAASSASSTASLAQTLTTIRQDAAKVFGGIFAALSQNPATLPAAAPAAAAGAAAVMGFSIAAGGWDNVPFDNMPTLLHAQEMVLPARLANPMRDMLAGYSSAAIAPSSHTVNFGDFTVNGAPSGMSSSEFRQALSDHATHVAGAVAVALRAGYQPPYKQPTGRL